MNRNEVEKRFPSDGEAFDVIVAGGGPAGIFAALAATAGGAKTLLLEDRAFFGGVGAVSGWMPINRLFLDGKSRGDLFDAFTGKLKSYGPDACREGKVSWVDGDGLHVHPDYLRLAVMELMEDAGCHYLLHSPVTGVEMEGSRVSAVVCDGKYGRRSYRAKVFVDASGDGDVAFHAGVPMRKGRERDGVFMPVTLGFVLAGVDEARLFEALKGSYRDYVDQIKAKSGEGYVTSMFYSFDRTTIPGEVSINNGGWNDVGVIDATNLAHVNIAHRTALQVAFDFVKIVRELGLPGLEDCRLDRVGAELGIRETRRIEGEYTLTLEDAQTGKEFEDVVARRYGTIDPGGLQEDKEYHGSIKSGHAYPYRCMLPKKAEALLVAGRCASLTHLGLTVCKSMGNMMGVGQAAGVAAALCVARGVTPRALDVSLVQRRLRDLNVPL